MCLKANEEQTSLSLLQPVGGEFLLRSSEKKQLFIMK